MSGWLCRLWHKVPADDRAWLRDTSERCVSTFAQAVIAAVLAGAFAEGVTLSTVHAVWLAGMAAALSVLKSAVGGLLPSLGVSPAALGLKRRKRAPAGTHVVRHRTIPETSEGRPPNAGRLGRHVRWDSRSLNYLVPKGSKPKTAVSWQRLLGILDQGDVGACTAFATYGALGTLPLSASLPAGTVLDAAHALKFYSAEETADGDGPYPPQDNGSTGLTAGQVAKAEGLISGYQHITSVAAAYTAIEAGPFIVGTNWTDGMDTPDSDGVVKPTGSVRGGHEYECVGYDPQTDLWEFCNSWGTGWGVNGRFFYSSATFAKLLAADGDATVFTPAAPAPAPTPTPTPTPAPPSDTVVVSDPPMVAHLQALAAKGGITPAGFLLGKLRKLYPTVPVTVGRRPSPKHRR